MRHLKSGRKSATRTWVSILTLAVSAGGVTASASTPLEDAIEPLERGIPEVAVVKLREQLSDAQSPGLTPETRKLAKTRLAEALLAAGRPAEALREVKDPRVAAPLLEARIEIALGHWAEALAVYEEIKGDETGNASGGIAGSADEITVATVALGKAECLRKLRRLDEAIAVLEAAMAKDSDSLSPVHPPATVPLRLAELYLEQKQTKKCAKLLSSIHPRSAREKQWKQYTEARLNLAQGYFADALTRFEDLQHAPDGLTTNIVIGSLLGMSDARAQLGGFLAADNVLEQFLWKYPESPRLDLIFRKLDAVYAKEENVSDTELPKWAKREPTLRAGYAAYYLAKAYVRAGKPDRALQALDSFATRFPKHPILPAALLIQGQILADEGTFETAQQSLDIALRATTDDLQRAEIEMASATAHFQAGDFVLAATVFRAVGERAPSLWQRAVFNSALSWLHQGNLPRFLDDYKELSQRFPESPYRRELILEEGLLQARQGSPQAEATLHQFLRDFPGNSRVPEAKLALAELRFAQNDMAGASQYIKAVNEEAAPQQANANPDTVRQSDYLAIFVADASLPRDDDKVIALCQAFMTHYPTAVQGAEVRMKLGQVYFRKEDFASARMQFETLARENPGSPLVERALFLAGQASMKSMSEGAIDHAIELFAEVAKMDGSLKFYARLQQAVAQNRLGKQDEAILIYDAILRADPPAEEKHAALAGKADNLMELGQKERDSYEKALAIYQQLAAEPEVSTLWRSQALYKEGSCLEALERPEEALAAYYGVLQAGISKPEEYFWFYKAGFDAGRLCEAREQWKSAIGIYQKMTNLDGPRSDEAKEQVNRIRLEHFIWE